ncbi:receptor-type tyrosine-protein phosphatase S-like [Neocloeon triangulifer]|uniref:receptor-type tyrosine-protein phosphatase S-like n=1 Tax=Neocloeon triangulifer TaxID=2078957 RepID=UPI00286F0E07|nr:receptor-type tyrosine-protein phosphatase S-like [Neocloeon triangulifer]XP_059481430.1 receptor-type tyrosine-protein phosphatase S-like [Neocloeon triangulifer]
MEGSDYIKASFIDGYKYRAAYIATQGPRAHTSENLWRMLWERNSTIIVLLTKLKEMGREKCFQYWPNEWSVRYDCLVVDPIAEYNMPQYILREFKISDSRDSSRGRFVSSSLWTGQSKAFPKFPHARILRTQRTAMVQTETEDQYIFINDALLEHFICGNSEVPARSLHSHLQRLLIAPIAPDQPTGMELEFKKLNN